MFSMLFQFYSSIYFHSLLTRYMHMHLPFILHSLRVLTPCICTSRSMCIIFLIRYLERITRIMSWVLSIRLLVFLFSFIPSFPWFLIYWTNYLFYSFIHLWSCVDIIYIIVLISIYHSDYIACSDYFRLSVYTWGILLAYIRRRLSSRLSFRVF